MSKTRRIGIVVILILIIGAFVLGPLLKSGGTKEYAELIGAEFSFPDNLALSFGSKTNIEIKLSEKSAVKLELFYRDSLIEAWKNPTGNVTYAFNSINFGLGAKEMTLVTTFSKGDPFVDTRIIRILSDVSPTNLTASVVSTMPHNPSHFTQGFEFSDGQLYESTGDPGRTGASKVMKVNLKDGTVQLNNGLDANYFGEGITILKDKLYEITWQEGTCFIYDKNTLKLLKDIKYTGEGWGLCNDGKSLIMSDGTEIITFRDPENFQVQRTIEVYDQAGPRVELNELEYIDGKIYANIWRLDIILVIDPNTGKVLSEIDCSALAAANRGNGEVLNGIAYNSATKKTYLTGKNWPSVVEVVFK